MNGHICFAGDLFAGGILLDEDPRNVVDSVTFRTAASRIANLEHAIGTGEPIARKSTLHAPPKAVEYLQALSIDAVSLANNHVQDLGPEGVDETIRHLEAAGIDWFGAGPTLAEAAEPYRVDDDFVVFGFCAFDSPSLTKIAVATEDSPGVNPLTREHVFDSLQDLDPGTRAILYVHWGIENVSFPPVEVVELAEDLLEHPRVAGIVGAHPHRVQGYTSHGHERAYFSLGNFCFPDFYLAPPVSVADGPPDVDAEYRTKRYHPVTEVTRKTWPLAARTSLLVTYDTAGGTFDHVPLFQDATAPTVRELTGLRRFAVEAWVAISKHVVEGPPLLHRTLLAANRVGYSLSNTLGILSFLYRQNGPRWMGQLFLVWVVATLDPDTSVNDRLYEFFEE
ncbi:MAG: CapA family protein [Halanaeroarchaeum sp.]